MMKSERMNSTNEGTDDMELDLDNVDLESVETISDADAAAYAEYVEEQEKVKKTDREIILDLFYQLETCQLSSWERGFCGSCSRWLMSSETAKLSFKQRAVFDKLVDKYSII